MEKENRRKWCLLGIPDHTAVMNLAGRVGAAGGPSAFRAQFARLNGRASVHSLCHDLGDGLEPTDDVVQTHRLLTERMAGAHATHELSVLVGGSHDHGYPHLRGLREAHPGKRIACINIDAHLDVRKPSPLITSGSPFYLAIEEGVIEPQRLVEFGIQAHCNAQTLWDYAEKKKVPVIPMEKLRRGKAVTAFEAALKKLSSKSDVVAISLDLDAIAAAHAPGVSAPQAEGFTGGEVVEMMEIAGRNPKVRSLGIFELNPEHDVEDKTARLAATAAWHFVAAWASRKKSG